MEVFEILSRPLFSNLLVLLGLVCLGISFVKKEPGPSLVLSFLAFGLVLIGLAYNGSVSLLIFVLAFLGGLFLVFESLVPGFGVFGIGGIGLLIGALVLPSPGLFTKLVSLSLGLVTVALVAIFLVKNDPSRMRLKGLVLDSQIDKTFNMKDLTGYTGRSLTILRPSGKVKIRDSSYDAISMGEFIDKDKEIVVVGVKNKRLYVKEL